MDLPKKRKKRHCLFYCRKTQVESKSNIYLFIKETWSCINLYDYFLSSLF